MKGKKSQKKSDIGKRKERETHKKTNNTRNINISGMRRKGKRRKGNQGEK